MCEEHSIPAHAIGVAKPLSVHVDSYGTGTKSDKELVEILGDAGASERSVTVTSIRKRNAFDEDADDMDDY